jgi:hypothetical protein
MRFAPRRLVFRGPLVRSERDSYPSFRYERVGGEPGPRTGTRGNGTPGSLDRLGGSRRCSFPSKVLISVGVSIFGSQNARTPITAHTSPKMTLAQPDEHLRRPREQLRDLPKPRREAPSSQGVLPPTVESPPGRDRRTLDRQPSAEYDCSVLCMYKVIPSGR